MIFLENLVFQSGLDLNVESQTWGFWAEIRKNPHAPRQARVRATHAVPAAEYLSPLCGRSQWGTQGQRLLLSGPVLRHGLRPVDLPRIPARHRSQLACPSKTAVPHGLSMSDDFAQHAGQCERHTPVANFCRLRSAPDWHCTTPVRHGALWRGARCGCVCLRRQHHRPVPVGVCMGTVSLDQGRHQTAHPARFEGQHPKFHSHHRRQDPRGQRHGRSGAGAGSLLPDGSGLSGLCTSVRDSRGQSILRDPIEEQHQVQAALLSPGGSNQYNGAVRPDRRAVGASCGKGLSHDDAPGGGQGRHRQTTGVSDQQLHLGTGVDRRPVPPALASGIVLQVDQAAFAHQGVLRHQRERGEDADMDCHIDLPADRHCQKTLAS